MPRFPLVYDDDEPASFEALRTSNQGPEATLAVLANAKPGVDKPRGAKRGGLLNLFLFSLLFLLLLNDALICPSHPFQTGRPFLQEEGVLRARRWRSAKGSEFCV